MVTLKELAKQLDVSISTVSKALHDSDEIGKETITRVKSLAKQLNYRPNRVALSLKQSRTKTIGVIIPSILNHFFAKALYGIEKEASKYGYNIITCLSNELYKNEEKNLELLANGSVDGFILSIAEESQKKDKHNHFNDILDQQIPIVMFDRVADKVDCDKVIIDDKGAVYNATKHLLSEGRKKIILLNNIKDLNVGKLRVEGYISAINEDKLYSEEVIVIESNKDNMEAKIETMFKTHSDVDGIISIDNTTGVIALNMGQNLGYDVPKDLSVIGFSDKNILPFTNPKLSTISQHAEDIGKTSVKVLIQRLNNAENDSGFKTRIIKTQLEKRGTTL